VASVQTNYDGGAYNNLAGDGNIAIGELAEGPHTLNLIATDALGNGTGTKSYTFTMDKSAPVAIVDRILSGITESDGMLYIPAGHALVVRADDLNGAGVAKIVIDGTDYTVNPASTPGYSAGVHQVSIKAEDRLGNIFEIPQFSLQAIANPPVTTAVFSGNTVVSGGNTIIQANTQINLNAKSDIPNGVSSIIWAMTASSPSYNQGAVFAGVSTGTVTIPAGCPEGVLVTFTYHSVDKLGLVETTSGVLQFVLDKSAPTAPGIESVSSVYVVGGKKFSGRTFDFRLPSVDLPAGLISGGVTVEYFVKEKGAIQNFATGTVSPGTVITYSAPQDQTIIVSYKSRDALGNESISPDYEITLQSAPQTVAVTFGPADKVFSNGSQTYIAPTGVVTIVKTGAASPEEDIEYQVEESGASLGAFMFGQTPKVVNIGIQDRLADIVYQLTGNISSRKIEKVILDTKGPIVSIVNPATGIFGSWITPTALIDVQKTDESAGVKAVFTSQNGVDYFSATPPISLGGIDRTVTLSVKATDNVGNESLIATRTYLVDGTKPVTSLLPGPGLASENGKNYAPTPWTFTVQSQDLGSGVNQVTVLDNGQMINPSGGSYSISGAGTHRVTFHGGDKVGNTEDEKTFDISLVGGAPTTPVGVVARAISSTGVQLTWNAVTGTGLSGYEVSLSDGTILGFATTTSFTKTDFVPDASIAVKVRTKNALGQYSAYSPVVTATPALQAPQITVPTTTDILTSFTIGISGKAESGAEILLLTGAESQTNQPASFVPPVYADTDGIFSGTSTFANEGANTISLFAAMPGLVRSGPAVRTLTFDLKPATPTGLRFTSGIRDTRLILLWIRVNENDIKEYRVFRDGNLVPIKIIPQTSVGVDPQFADLAQSNGKTYSYRVIAVDMAGNKSDMSAEVLETTVGGSEWSK